MSLRILQFVILTLATLVSQCLFGQTTIYSEDFTGQNTKGVVGSASGITIDTTGVDWSIDTTNVSFQDSLDYVQVVNEKIEFRDIGGVAKWTSPSIVISNFDSLTLAIDLSEVGTMEASDSIAVYFKIDNGSEILVQTITDDFSSVSLLDTALSGTGSSMSIIVYCSNGADTEKHRIDNIEVKGKCGSIPSESSNFAASAALTTTDLTWNAPTCSDEVLIVAKSSSTISGTPTGDGTSYTAVADFSGAGTVFDGGKVVYKGTGTSISVTNLSSSSTYFYKIWSRTGSSWTSGIEINSATAYVPKLLISEVADPSDNINARFVELFNADSVSIDFSTIDYYVCKETNGGGSYSCTQLSGSLSPGGTYVVANNSTAFNTEYGQNPSGTFSNTAGNGDDGYFLYIGGNNTTGTLLDAYGVIGQDGTGQTWEYTDSRAYRDSNHATPNTTWSASEWTISSSAASACKPFDHISAYPIITVHSNYTLAGGSYGTITINGSSIVVSANADITIQNSINLTDGMLNMASNKMNLGTNTHNCTISGGSSTSYLYGGSIKSFVNNSTATYNFPIGSSSTEYSPISVDFTSSTLATGAYLESTISDSKHPNFDGHVTSYIDRNWSIEPTGITSPVYSIQLDYVDADIIGTESSILPVKYSGGSWTAPGDIGNNNVDTVGAGTIDTASNFLSWTGVTSFSIFGGAGSGAPLPVELISFSGKKHNSGVLLNWETSSEINNDYFIIERVLEEGSSIKIGIIEGHGTSNEAHTYNLIDYAPEVGINYYRLSQMDINGTLNRHEIIALEIESNNNESEPYSYFNNSTNQLIIRNFEISNGSVKILNINGNEVDFELIEISTTNATIDLNELENGVYFLVLKSETNYPITLKFLR